MPGASSDSYPDGNQPFIRVEASAKFFWDIRYPNMAPHPFHQNRIDGAAYYTAFSGDADGHRAVCVNLRRQRFDPQVTLELTKLADRRKNSMSNAGVVEKAKGVDIGLSVRVIEDAYHNIFDTCYLFTSDIDFLPVVAAIQRIGKKVIVFGYMDGLGTRSKLEYVPDGFVDLSSHMSGTYKVRGAG
jgi:uncharacterized LabA/DUF88 family protein